MYDVVIIGGGTSGSATAISAAKEGLKVLVVEKNSFLGGSMTGAMVVPMMKNFLKNGVDLSGNFPRELMSIMEKQNEAITFNDNNYGWFNPEMLKCTLDDLFEKYNIDVYFDSIVIDTKIENNKIVSCDFLNCGQKHTIEAKYFVDASGNGDLINLAGIPFENGNNSQNQAMTLRFVVANVDIKKFAKFLRNTDKDEEISPICEINGNTHLSTACTWDNENWKLLPIFKKAVEDGVLQKEDCAYFQIFTIAGQPNAITFNAPRIYAEKNLNPLEIKDTSYALKQGRKQIRRLMNFTKKYLPGFENAYISQIAPMLGIRDSRRVDGVYKLTKDDIITNKRFDNVMAKSNYPIDVHSREKNKSMLTKMEGNSFFEIPLDSMKVKNITNLYVTGKIISADFLSQAALRIIPNCLSMGESLGKYLANKSKN